MKQTFHIETNIKITVLDLNGNIKDIVEFPNLITTDGLNMVRDGLYGVGGAQDLEVKVLAVGDDNTAPVVGDSTLVNETWRKARTSQSKPADGQTRYVQYVDPTEANFADIGRIEEIGWFAGDLVNAATPAGADTGIMISRVLYSRAKTALESLQIERVDTFVEG